MKKIIFILILIYNLTFAICNCSAQWYQVNLPVTGTIQQVQLVNQNVGWSMIQESSTKFTLIKTINGGLNWTPIFSDSAKVMRFQFINDSIGYGMGKAYVNQLLLKTTNGGYNWTIMQSTQQYALAGFFFVNSDTGWVNAFSLAAQTTFITRDGFQTLESIATGAGGNPAKIYFFKEPYNGGLCGYMRSASLWKTTNSGYNWTQLSFSGIVYGSSFINKDTGWVNLDFENSSIYKTTNAGVNWNLQYQDNRLNSIFAVTANKIWCGTDHGYISVSTNGGLNWGRQLSPISTNYNVYMYDTSFGFVFSGIELVRTTNGGGQINSIQKISENVPNEYELKQNYPNPLNPSTNIEFQLSKQSLVYLQVFDILGRKVADLIDSKEYSSGTYRVNFDMSEKNFSGGVYFYRLTVYPKDGNKIFTSTKKMVYNK